MYSVTVKAFKPDLRRDPDESYVEANRDGLELFAAILLGISLEMEGKDGTDNNEITSFEIEEDWMKGDTIIQYAKAMEPQQRKEEASVRILDHILPFGCVALFICVLAPTIVGALEILSWVI